jgi:hypothetical protein
LERQKSKEIGIIFPLNTDEIKDATNTGINT